MYHCHKCSKWFEKSTKVKDRILGERNLCPFCKQRVFLVTGIRPALVALWWWFKELFIRKKKGIEKVTSKAKAIEKEFEELVERYSKLQRILKLRESEILADFIKWTRSLIGELEKIKEEQAEFEARVNKLMVRIFKLEVRTANERKTP